jgi:hypothetical protein
MDHKPSETNNKQKQHCRVAVGTITGQNKPNKIAHYLFLHINAFYHIGFVATHEHIPSGYLKH